MNLEPSTPNLQPHTPNPESENRFLVSDKEQGLSDPDELVIHALNIAYRLLYHSTLNTAP